MTHFEGIIRKLANVIDIKEVASNNLQNEKPAAALSFMIGTAEFFVPMPENVDRDAEIKKIQDDLKYTEGFLRSVLAKLSNEKFVNGAPEKVVAIERQKKADAEQKIAALKKQLDALK